MQLGSFKVLETFGSWVFYNIIEESYIKSSDKEKYVENDTAVAGWVETSATVRMVNSKRWHKVSRKEID